jgi:hypothetical protein
MANLTVREIAEQIRRPHEDLITVVDRLRGWTDAGLIKASGERHPGTGRQRVYREAAITDALLLTGLLDAGLSPLRFSQLKEPGGASILSLGHAAVKKVRSDPERKKVQYLVIFGRTPVAADPGLGPYSVYLSERSSDDRTVQIVADAEWSTVLNINQLLDGIKA